MEPMTGAESDAVRNVCRNGQFSEAVILAVAEANDVDPLDLDPLHTAVDPDALNSMFQPSFESPPTDLELRFSMAGCEVVVHGDGEIVVTPQATTDGRATPIVSRDG